MTERAEPSGPLFFETPEAFRAWLSSSRGSGELWVGFYKKGAGRASLTWPEAVDEALCAGWIDGVRRTLDESSYVIRFTPRRASSKWSQLNVARFAELQRSGRVSAEGVAAFEARAGEVTPWYSDENKLQQFDPLLLEVLRRDAAASAYFETQPPSYRKAATYWVMSAKQDSTRARRMGVLVECSGRGEAIPPLRRPAGRG